MFSRLVLVKTVTKFDQILHYDILIHSNLYSSLTVRLPISQSYQYHVKIRCNLFARNLNDLLRGLNDLYRLWKL